MFCPICGKESKGICKECYLQRTPLSLRDFALERCPKCGKFLPEDEEKEKIIYKKIKKNLIHGEKIKIVDIKAYSKDEKFENFMNLKIIVFCEYEEEKFEKEFNVQVKILKKLCLQCSRLLSNYSEAVLQLRGNKEKIKEAFNKLDKHFISSAKELKEGLDVYLISKSYAFSLISIFANEGAEIKQTKKLIGLKDGQRVYRAYILIRFPDINVGDKVEYENKIYKVIKVGKFVVGENINGKKKQFPLKSCKKI